MLEKNSQERRTRSHVRSKFKLFKADINDAFCIDAYLLKTVIEVLNECGSPCRQVTISSEPGIVRSEHRGSLVHAVCPNDRFDAICVRRDGCA